MIPVQERAPAQTPVLGKLSPALSPGRSLAFFVALVLVAVRFGQLHQFSAYLLHVNLKLLYFLGIPALAGVLTTGGLRRTFERRTAYYWTAYAAWMFAIVPLSFWKGGSFGVAWSFLRTEFPIRFVIAGLTLTWRDCEKMMMAVAAGGVFSVLEARLFENEVSGGRLALEFGTIANSNDFACHMLLVLPFILWLVLKPRSPAILRLVAAAAFLAGIVVMLRTGSRGGFLGIAGALLFFLVRGSNRQRIGLIVLAPVAFAAITAIVGPSAGFGRIKTLWSGDNVEAAESADSREYLLRKSLEYTLKFPIFGVGPGQFPNYEGGNNAYIGTHGYFHQTHNVFTQVSSECGIPGLFFFVAGLISTFTLLHSTHRKARRQPGCGDMRLLVFCIMLGMAGFFVAVTFLNFAYAFYMPALGGLAIAVSRAAEEEFTRRASEAPQPAAFAAAPARWARPAAASR